MVYILQPYDIGNDFETSVRAAIVESYERCFEPPKEVVVRPGVTELTSIAVGLGNPPTIRHIRITSKENFDLEPNQFGLDESHGTLESFQATDKVIVLVVGWSPPTVVDEKQAREHLLQAYDAVEETYPDHQVIMVSGLTNVGIMAIAYPEAAIRGWYLVGYACEKARNYELYHVDEKNIYGDNWGDESPHFVGRAIKSGHPFGIINIAGGEQAANEMAAIKAAGGFVSHFDLERKQPAN